MIFLKHITRLTSGLLVPGKCYIFPDWFVLQVVILHVYSNCISFEPLKL